MSNTSKSFVNGNAFSRVVGLRTSDKKTVASYCAICSQICLVRGSVTLQYKSQRRTSFLWTRMPFDSAWLPCLW